MRALFFAFFSCWSTVFFAQTTFNKFDDFLAYVNTKDIDQQVNDIKLLRAKKAKIAALAAIPDLNVNVSSNFTNNTQLPVNVFPAQAFGGPEGEFREIQMGVQYNTSFSQMVDLKLLNLEGWQNLKLAKINIDITEADNKQNLKNLYENIASAYYNIVQLNAQLSSSKKNLTAADTLVQVAQQKFEQGLGKQQDLNDSKVNRLNLAENVRQIEYLLQQSYLSLKTLSDIPEAEAIAINEKPEMAPALLRPSILMNDLAFQSSLLREQSALSSLKKANQAFAPTLSFVFSNSSNQYNPDFTIFGGNWIPSQYVGLKFNFNLPNAHTISNRSNARFEYALAQKSSQEAKMKTDLAHQQLGLDWDKAKSQEKNNAEILDLQRDTYLKNQNLYREGLLGIDRTINSFNGMVNAEYNLITAKVNAQLAQAKIDINNKMLR
jgi:outer membrane protein TolC